MNGDLIKTFTNGTSCKDDYIMDSNIYRKIVGTIIFVVIWPFIVLDIKRFPLGRPAAALLGATLMVISVVVPQDQVYHILGEKGNLQTLCLLIGMMMLSYYYDREGLLHVVALWILGKKKPFRYVLWKVCILSAVLSAIITNDATCLVITPLLLNEHIKQKRSPKEYPSLLIGIATSANIGSASTFFGNPQNAFIAANSKGQVSLLIFIVTALPAAILGLVFSVGLLYLFYIRTICSSGRRVPILDATTEILSNGEEGGEGDDYVDIAARSRTNSDLLNLTNVTEITELNNGDVTLSYDRSIDSHCTGQIADERVKHFQYLETYPGSTSSSYSRTKCYPVEAKSAHVKEQGNHLQLLSSPEYGTTKKATQLQHSNGLESEQKSRLRGQSHNDNVRLLTDESVICSDSSSPTTSQDTTTSQDSNVPSKWKKRVFSIWLIAATFILVVLLAIPPPPTVSAEFNLGLVPVALSVFTMVVDTLINKKYAFEAMMKIDWTVILMFIGLFIWLGGFENTKFPSRAFEFMRPYMDLYTIRGVFIFIAFVVIGSNILSNVPLVILIVNQLDKFYCSRGGENSEENHCSAQLVGVFLAWISTIAGNFTLIGSVANLIVAEKARNVADYHLTFWEYFKFGVCSTVIVLFIGTPIVYFAGANVHF